MLERRRRILVAMSGGVDSSVAAALLVEAGHDVVGATMKTFCYSGNTGPTKTCCGLDGIQDAQRVAAKLGIPHYVFDVEEDFTRDVIDDFVHEYSQGRTPNPCVRCNSNTKFRDLFKRGRVLGCEGVASGHYVRVDHTESPPRLLRGVDPAKDQSYFLWGLPANLLKGLLFPLGELTKPEVRSRARALELATADKPESQEICFVPTGNYRDLLEKRLLPTHAALAQGPIVHVDGRIIGTHNGYAGFTVGQRKGLGGGAGKPLFVVEIRPASREVVVGPRSSLTAEGAEVGDLNWLGPAPQIGDALQVQIRYRAAPIPCVIESITTKEATVGFPLGAHAVTPGQSSVFFAKDRVLGGGRIRRSLVAVRTAV